MLVNLSDGKHYEEVHSDSISEVLKLLISRPLGTHLVYSSEMYSSLKINSSQLSYFAKTLTSTESSIFQEYAVIQTCLTALPNSCGRDGDGSMAESLALYTL